MMKNVMKALLAAVACGWAYALTAAPGDLVRVAFSHYKAPSNEYKKAGDSWVVSGSASDGYVNVVPSSWECQPTYSVNAARLTKVGGGTSPWGIAGFSAETAGAGFMNENVGLLKAAKPYFPGRISDTLTVDGRTYTLGTPLQSDLEQPDAATTNGWVTFNGLTPGGRYEVMVLGGRKNTGPSETTTYGFPDAQIERSEVLECYSTTTVQTNGSIAITPNGQWALMRFTVRPKGETLCLQGAPVGNIVAVSIEEKALCEMAVTFGWSASAGHGDVRLENGVNRLLLDGALGQQSDASLVWPAAKLKTTDDAASPWGLSVKAGSEEYIKLGGTGAALKASHFDKTQADAVSKCFPMEAVANGPDNRTPMYGVPLMNEERPLEVEFNGLSKSGIYEVTALAGRANAWGDDWNTYTFPNGAVHSAEALAYRGQPPVIAGDSVKANVSSADGSWVLMRFKVQAMGPTLTFASNAACGNLQALRIRELPDMSAMKRWTGAGDGTSWSDAANWKLSAGGIAEQAVFPELPGVPSVTVRAKEADSDRLRVIAESTAYTFQNLPDSVAVSAGAAPMVLETEAGQGGAVFGHALSGPAVRIVGETVTLNGRVSAPVCVFPGEDGTPGRLLLGKDAQLVSLYVAEGCRFGGTGSVKVLEAENGAVLEAGTEPLRVNTVRVTEATVPELSFPVNAAVPNLSPFGEIVADCSAWNGLPAGTAVSPLCVKNASDRFRVQWEELPRGTQAPQMNPETGTWTTTVTLPKDRDNFIVMPLGDSLTEGSGGSEQGAPTYRRALFEAMKTIGMKPRSVGARIYKSSDIADPDCKLHTGLSGQRMLSYYGAGGYLQGIETWLEQAGYPDVITLMIGTNDRVKNPPNQTENTEAQAEIVFNRWTQLVKRILAYRPDTWLIVASISPMRTGEDEMSVFTPAYNNRIKALFDLTETTRLVDGQPVRCVTGTLNAAGKACFGASARLRFASVYDALPSAAEGNKAFYHDRMHPNQAGHNRVAAVWLEAIKQLRGPNGGLSDAEKMVAAYQTAGAMDTVTIVFNHEQQPDRVRSEDFVLTVNGKPATIAEAVLSTQPNPLIEGSTGDCRRVTLKLAAPLKHGDAVRVERKGLVRTFTVVGASAPERLGTAFPKGFRLAKTLDVDAAASYTTADAAAKAFSASVDFARVYTPERVGYYVTLARPDGELRYVWADMNSPWTEKAKLGLPTFNLRTRVTGLRVLSNVAGVDNVPEANAEGLMQFCAGDLTKKPADSEWPQKIASYNGNFFHDWNCAAHSFNANQLGYGAMQLFRVYPQPDGAPGTGAPAATLFSYSRWGIADGTKEILLGDLANHQGYAGGGSPSVSGIFLSGIPTFDAGAYAVRRIEVWVKNKPAQLPGNVSEYLSEEVMETVTDLTQGKPVARIDMTLNGTAETSPERLNAVLSCFEGVAKVSGNIGADATLEVALSFGVSKMKREGNTFIFGAGMLGPQGSKVALHPRARLEVERKTTADPTWKRVESAVYDPKTGTVSLVEPPAGGKPVFFRIRAVR